MFSYSVYKILHLSGIFMVLLSVGGVALHVINGGNKDFEAKKFIGKFHGVGLLFILVAGFGMLARLHEGALQGWVITKIFVWLSFAGITALIYRSGSKAKLYFVLALFLSVTAAYMALYKPF